MCWAARQEFRTCANLLPARSGASRNDLMAKSGSVRPKWRVTESWAVGLSPADCPKREPLCGHSLMQSPAEPMHTCPAVSRLSPARGVADRNESPYRGYRSPLRPTGRRGYGARGLPKREGGAVTKRMRKTSGRRRGNSDGPHGAPRLSKSGGEEPRRRRTDVWSRSGEDASPDRLQPPRGVVCRARTSRS